MKKQNIHKNKHLLILSTSYMTLCLLQVCTCIMQLMDLIHIACRVMIALMNGGVSLLQYVTLLIVSSFTGTCIVHTILTPQYLFPFIKTPMFIANSLYDTAQLAGILHLGCLPPNCPEDKMKFFDNFRTVSA